MASKILLFPYVATGHITPFLELAKSLSDRGFSIDLCSTPTNIHFIKRRISSSYTIHLVELQLPDLPELPANHHTTNGLAEHQKNSLSKALRLAKPEFYQILNARKPDLLIHDVVGVLWAARVASRLNIPAIKYYGINASAFCFLNHLYFTAPGTEFPFPEIHIKDYEKERVFTTIADEVDEDVDRTKEMSECERILMVRSSRALEAKYIDYTRKLGIKLVPVGALFVEQPVNTKLDDGESESEDTEFELMKWLGEKKEHSTVYVSFGSEYYLTKEEMEEVAYGLELSGVNFIWVVRFPLGEVNVKLEEVLPLGFLERIRERGSGRILRGWAPQVKILRHPSIGAFISHCGWSSILESMSFRVPIIAMPMVYDQPVVARLLVAIGAAVEVARDENGKLIRANIAKNIKLVINGEDEIGKNLRRKVDSLCEDVTLRRDEEMNEAVEVITKVIRDNKIALIEEMNESETVEV